VFAKCVLTKREDEGRGGGERIATANLSTKNVVREEGGRSQRGVTKRLSAYYMQETPPNISKKKREPGANLVATPTYPKVPYLKQQG